MIFQNYNKNMKLFFNAYIILCLLFLSSCRFPGPAQKIYNGSIKEYAASIKLSDPVQKDEKLNQIFRTLIPLLSDASYSDANDSKEKLTIMFQSSLLLSAVALKLGRKKDSITFFMNAYLLSEHSSRKYVILSLRELAPESDKIPEFQKIIVPQYKVQKVSEMKPGIFEAQVELVSDLPDLILEMAAGDILYKMKYTPGIIQDPANLQSLQIKMKDQRKDIATANWNSKEDQIVVKRLHRHLEKHHH